MAEFLSSPNPSGNGLENSATSHGTTFVEGFRGSLLDGEIFLIDDSVRSLSPSLKH